MTGLKGLAIERGAHRTCMASGRAAACEPCLVIVDRIIAGRRALLSGARPRTDVAASAAPHPVAYPDRPAPGHAADFMNPSW